jgi:hypothetical protein
MNRLVPIAAHVPALVLAAGERAQTRFWEFFVNNIRNPRTRRAYARAAKEFFDWLAVRGVPTARQGRSVKETAWPGRQAFRHPSRNKRTAASSLRSSCKCSSRPANRAMR